MAIIGKTMFMLFFLSSIFSIASSRKEPSSSNIDWWCNLTPHPKPCKHYTTQMNNHFKIKHRVEFREMLVQLALNQALTMQKDAQENSQQQQNSSVHKKVHGDCLKLFENTIFHLNRTLEGLNDASKNCSPDDAQTWLTTSLTNIDTCKSGALELNAQDFNFIMQTNVTEMIRNILAINMHFLKHSKGTNNDFIFFYLKLSIVCLEKLFNNFIQYIYIVILI